MSPVDQPPDASRSAGPLVALTYPLMVHVLRSAAVVTEVGATKPALKTDAVFGPAALSHGARLPVHEPAAGAIVFAYVKLACVVSGEPVLPLFM